MKKLRYFFKFYFVYALLFILPIILLSFVLNAYIIEQIKRESIQNNVNAVSDMQQYLDNQFGQIAEISNKVFYESNSLRPFSVLRASSTEKKALAIAAQLGSLRSSQSVFDEIGLYFHGEDVIYTSESVYSLDLFGRLFEAESISAAESRSLLNGPEGGVFRTRGNFFNHRPYIVLVRPGGSGNSSMSLLYFVSIDRLSRMIGLANTFPQRNVVLLHGDLELFNLQSAQNALPAGGTSAAAGLAEELADMPYRVASINGENHYAFARQSVVSQFTYLFTISEREIVGRSRQTQTVYTASVLSLLLLEGCGIYVALRLIYRPVRKLTRYTEQFADQETGQRDDLDVIRHTLDTLLSRNSELADQVKESCISVKNQLIYELINGEISSIEEFNKLGRFYGIHFAGQLYWVASLLPRADERWNANTLRYKAWVASLVENNLPDGLEGYCSFDMGSNRFTLFAASDRARHDFFDQLYSVLTMLFPRGITMGVSDPAESAAQIPEAYIQSVMASRYSFIAGTAQLIRHADLRFEKSAENYPLGEVRELKSAIRMGDAGKIRELCGKFAQAIKGSSNYQHIMRRLCYDVVGMVDDYVYENDRSTFLSQQYTSDIFLLENYDTVSELIEFIETICLRCCALRGGGKPDEKAGEKAELADRVRAYIDLNYAEEDFTVQSVASYFSMNISNLSHFFKAKTGETLLNYILARKMGRACELLAAGEQVEAVARRLGYQNTSSFIRRFRLTVGSTPGEYRQWNAVRGGMAEKGT
jgi:AraC-like DNA-binding protein